MLTEKPDLKLAAKQRERERSLSTRDGRQRRESLERRGLRHSKGRKELEQNRGTTRKTGGRKGWGGKDRGNARDLNAGDLNARVLNARVLNAMVFNAGNFNAKVLSTNFVSADFFDATRCRSWIPQRGVLQHTRVQFLQRGTGIERGKKMSSTRGASTRGSSTRGFFNMRVMGGF